MTERRQRLTVLFVPESAYGPTNNCVGIADVLRRRGHRVVFAAEASWKGRLAALGFEEDLVDLAPPPADGAPEQDPGQFWKDFVRDTAPEFRKPTIQQLETWIRPVWEELTAGARHCEPQLKEIIARTRPDVIVEDNVVAFPALLTAGVPFVRINSCNPLEIKSPAVPPAFSGCPTADRTGWAAFRAEYDRTHRELWTSFNAWVVEQGAPPLADLEFIHESETANLYVYPGAADYPRELGPTWRRLDSCVRETDSADFDVPPGEGALVYFSLGSLGSADVELMRRVIGVLAKTPHRYVVSMGPLHEEIELAANMTGAEFLPQASVLPHVDLVITHGGNNTTTESLHFGKPMVVLPLFWDQYDNAQRMDELGFGVRLDPYRCTDGELTAAIDRLLADTALRERLAATGSEIRGRDGLRTAADAVERSARAAGAAGPTGVSGLRSRAPR
ncbi:glycosyltransferase [Streptomyces sp. Wb2n-11]|uniref:glycosyltransferase n=1 Tax=Streptomyces sp. Wb2n-11 TaxID=1030533 RepID=UPI000A659D18|nr:nucleotide disphospho-sugar-binding domain-containing protein [Streptomyces sp. Wb2n-11]